MMWQFTNHFPWTHLTLPSWACGSHVLPFPSPQTHPLKPNLFYYEKKKKKRGIET